MLFTWKPLREAEVGCGVSQLSVTVTEYLRKSTYMEEEVFGLTVSEVMGL